MKLYTILYRLPGKLVFMNGEKEERVDDLRDSTREIDGEYTLLVLPDGRRAIHRLDQSGMRVEPPVFVEERKE